MATDPKQQEPPADAKARREAKLAEALRANLRRRKAAPAPDTVRKTQDGDST